MVRDALIVRLATRCRPVAIALAALAAGPLAGGAHEIPQSVTIIAYLKPEGTTLRLVARVPLAAMRDIQWPLRGPGYLELGSLDELLRDGAKIWVADNVRLFENGAPLPAPTIRATRISLQSDRSFESYEAASAHVLAARLPATTELAWQQAMVDVILEYPVASADARFSIEPALARLGVRTTTVLRFVPPQGAERVFTYDGDPGLVHLDPNWAQTAGRFVTLGFTHILDGLDHLLFILCLVIPFRQLRPLLVIVTAFTVAHSITMVASALGYAPDALWFPPLVEVLIALSIVYTAIENIVGARLDRRWAIAFGFGLVHGFGFSFALRESLQFAGAHLATSLAMFNVGVELAQVAVVVLAVPVLTWGFARVVAERPGTILVSALVIHTSWHWMTERWTAFRAHPLVVPPLDAAFGAAVLRVGLVAAIAGAAVWVGRPIVAKLLGPTPPGRAGATPRDAGP